MRDPYRRIWRRRARCREDAARKGLPRLASGDVQSNPAAGGTTSSQPSAPLRRLSALPMRLRECCDQALHRGTSVMTAPLAS